MRKHSSWFILAIAVLCLFCFTGYGIIVKGEGSQPENTGNTKASFPQQGLQSPSIYTDVTSPTKSTALLPEAVLNCKYYNPRDFMSSVSAADSVAMNSESTADSSTTGSAFSTGVHSGIIAGGVVPHHLLAGKMIAAFFKTLSKSDPDTLVILAPNHGRIGHNSLNTSLLGWSTVLGTLENETDITNWIISKMGASQDNTLMEEEHSISSLIPYVKYYMPKVKIVPLLLHGNYPKDKSEELGRQLAINLSGTSSTSNTAIIASVDFSHYLDAVTANKMDEKTLSAIKAFDIKGIDMMGNDNLDSPPSIIALLSAMKELGATDLEVLDHNNSSVIAGKGADYTTSYFTLLYKR